MWRILCVEDDNGVARDLVDYFQEWHDDNPYGGFEVSVEPSFDNAIERLKNEHFDLVTLDLHGAGDADPMKDAGNDEDQEGKRVLNSLRATRFVPVIFYTGFADRIGDLQTGVVRVVKKGEDDPNGLRAAARAIHATGLPELLRHIDKEKREFMWDTVDRHWADVGTNGSPTDLAYLLARRLAARFNRESVKELLTHRIGAARPIEMYIYPPIATQIKTGCVIKDEKDEHWVVATPACDFAQSKADQVLLVGTNTLTSDDRYTKWSAGAKWKGVGAQPGGSDQAAWNKLSGLIKNNAGDRWRFLPGTFFIPDLVVDFQKLKQLPVAEIAAANVVCQIDSPFREELLLQASRYYGRVGTPDLETAEVFGRL